MRARVRQHRKRIGIARIDLVSARQGAFSVGVTSLFDAQRA